WSHAHLGDHQEALSYCQQALLRLQELGDSRGQADTWDSLGYAHHHLGHHTEAVSCYQHALDLYRDHGDRYEEAVTLIRLGDTHQRAGTPAAAREAWRPAMTTLDDLHHPDADKARTRLHHPAPPPANRPVPARSTG